MLFYLKTCFPCNSLSATLNTDWTNTNILLRIVYIIVDSLYHRRQFISSSTVSIIVDSFYHRRQFLSSSTVYIIVDSFYHRRQFISSSTVSIIVDSFYHQPLKYGGLYNLPIEPDHAPLHRKCTPEQR